MNSIRRLIATTILSVVPLFAAAQQPSVDDTCIVFADGTVVHNIWYLRDISPTASFGNYNDYFETRYHLLIRKIMVSYASGEVYVGWGYWKNQAQWDSLLEGQSYRFLPILGTTLHADFSTEPIFIAPKEMLAEKGNPTPVGKWRRIHNPVQVEYLEFLGDSTGVETIETKHDITIPLEGGDSRYDWRTGTYYPRNLTGGYTVTFTTNSVQQFRWNLEGDYLTLRYYGTPTVSTAKALDMHTFDRYDEEGKRLSIRQSQQDMKTNPYVKKHVKELDDLCRDLLPEEGDAVSYLAYAFLKSGIVLIDTNEAVLPNYSRGYSLFSRKFSRLRGSAYIFLSLDNDLVRTAEPQLLLYSMYEQMGRCRNDDLIAIDVKKELWKRLGTSR